MDWDEPQKRPSRSFELGGDLSPVSIADLKARVHALKAEIGRIEAAIAAKEQHKADATSVFKL